MVVQFLLLVDRVLYFILFSCSSLNTDNQIILSQFVVTFSTSNARINVGEYIVIFCYRNKLLNMLFLSFFGVCIFTLFFCSFSSWLFIHRCWRLCTLVTYIFFSIQNIGLFMLGSSVCCSQAIDIMCEFTTFLCLTSDIMFKYKLFACTVQSDVRDTYRSVNRWMSVNSFVFFFLSVFTLNEWESLHLTF